MGTASFSELLYCLGFFFFLNLFTAVLGLRFYASAFSSCSKWGPLFIAVRGPLTVAASLVAEHRLQTRRLSSCGSRAQLPRGMWDPPRPGLEPMSPALAGRFSTTAPPGKPCLGFLKGLGHHLKVLWSKGPDMSEQPALAQPYLLFIQSQGSCMHMCKQHMKSKGGLCYWVGLYPRRWCRALWEAGLDGTVACSLQCPLVLHTILRM